MILVLVEHADGRPDGLALEALAFAARLAGAGHGPVEAVVFGPDAAPAAAGLGAYGVATAHVVEEPALGEYAPAGWASALVQLIAAREPTIVLAAGSVRGNEVLAHLGARTGLPVAANCVEAGAGDRFRVVRQRWGGSLLEEAWLDAPVRLLSVAPHGLPPAEPAPDGVEPAVLAFTPTLDARDLRVRVTSREPAATSGTSLAEAKVVVGGGRGVGSAEGFAVLEELAGLLSGAVGVSRVATSAGWRPHAEQIGQTGLRIAPELYIACGISGAIQHIVGCKAAKRILVINKDPDAPIMSRANWAVIGDLHEVVPAISAEIRRATGRA